MGDIQPKRRVLPFPAEIRLGIYRYLLSKVYCAINTVPQRCTIHPRYNGKPVEVSPGLVILRVSKATSSEVLKLLFDESAFVFKLDFTTPFFCDELSRETAALMKNVWFEVSAEVLASGSAHAGFFWRTKGLTKQEQMTQSTLGLFTGTRCFRKVMRIRVMDCAPKKPLCMPHAFYEAMKDLGGFQKLVVEFEFPHSLEPEPDKFTRGLSERFKDLFLKRIFEPVYGPAVQHDLHGVDKYTCYIEFCPRQHLAARLTERAGKMLEEAARLTDRPAATDSLPAIVEKLKCL